MNSGSLDRETLNSIMNLIGGILVFFATISTITDVKLQELKIQHQGKKGLLNYVAYLDLRFHSWPLFVALKVYSESQCGFMS